MYPCIRCISGVCVVNVVIVFLGIYNNEHPHTPCGDTLSLSLAQKNIAELQTLFRSSCRETLFASEKLRQCAHVSSRCMFEREFIYYIAYLGVSSGHSTSVSKYITHAFVQFFSRKSIKYIVTSKTGDNKLIVYSYLRI